MIKKAQMQWTGGFQFVGYADSGHAVVTDVAREHGGTDVGPRPAELPLLGLAACTGFDVLIILKKMKISFESFEITVEAEPVDEHPKIWKEIRVKYIIRGNVPEKKLQKAIALSHEKYCSVGVILGATAKMTYNYEILPAK